ncbi:hypothetical protein GCM10008992_21070 [Halorubrum aquaticum]
MSGKPIGAAGDGPRMTFGDLFERAADYDVDEEAVSRALAERRGERGEER